MPSKSRVLPSYIWRRYVCDLLLINFDQPAILKESAALNKGADSKGNALRVDNGFRPGSGTVLRINWLEQVYRGPKGPRLPVLNSSF